MANFISSIVRTSRSFLSPTPPDTAGSDDDEFAVHSSNAEADADAAAYEQENAQPVSGNKQKHGSAHKVNATKRRRSSKAAAAATPPSKHPPKSPVLTPTADTYQTASKHAPTHQPAIPQHKLLQQHLQYSLSSTYIQQSPQHLLPHYTPQVTAIRQSLVATIEEGRNNVLMLFGAHGCGKTTVLQTVLNDLHQTYNMHTNTDSTAPSKSFVTVQLNGQLYTDDTMAMRDIVKQLQIACDDVELGAINDFYTSLAYLYETLAEGRYKNRTIIFVIKNFESFVLQRSKQTLLYNLCDLLQSQRAQISIIGLTTRLDIADYFEKRVKSRMVYRDVLFAPVDIQAVKQSLAQWLKVDSWDASTQLTSATIDKHNAAVDQLMLNREFLHLLTTQHLYHRSISWYKLVVTYALSMLTADIPNSQPSMLMQAIQHLRTDWLTQSLYQCNLCELTLLACICYLVHQSIHEVNAVLIYDTYIDLSKAQQYDTTMREAVYSKSLVIKTIDLLLQRQLIVSTETMTTQLQGFKTWSEKSYQKVKLNITTYAFKSCIEGWEKQQAKSEGKQMQLPTYLKEWVKHLS